MAELPRPETPLVRRIADYAFGIVHEVGWILVLCVLAYVMAVAAIAVYR